MKPLLGKVCVNENNNYLCKYCLGMCYMVVNFTSTTMQLLYF